MSNVIKSFSYIALDDKKLIEALRIMPLSTPEESGMTSEQLAELNEVSDMKDHMIRDAEMFAQETIEQAMNESAALREQAQTEIEAWWQQRRADDEGYIEESRRAGWELGYREGLSQAETAVRNEHEAMLLEARCILEQAYALKQQIIQEAEPFLIELSSAVAEKIVDRQLTIEPSWSIEYIRRLLQRRKEKGSIALCVSPSQFGYIQDAREELLNAVDSQAELVILPDASVRDVGCVICSSYGTIDARIDTQLKEIKAVLHEIAIRGEG